MTEMTAPVLVRGLQPSWTGAGCIMQLRTWMHYGHTHDLHNVSLRASDQVDSYDRRINDLLITLNDMMCTETEVFETVDPKTPVPFLGDRKKLERLCSCCTVKLLRLSELFEGTRILMDLLDADESQEINYSLNVLRMGIDTMAMHARLVGSTSLNKNPSWKTWVRRVEEFAERVQQLKDKHQIMPCTTLSVEQAAAKIVSRANYRPSVTELVERHRKEFKGYAAQMVTYDEVMKTAACHLSEFGKALEAVERNEGPVIKMTTPMEPLGFSKFSYSGPKVVPVTDTGLLVNSV